MIYAIITIFEIQYYCIFSNKKYTHLYNHEMKWVFYWSLVLMNDETDPNAVIDASYVCNSDDSCDRRTPTYVFFL